jgi:hypothetical protein
MTAPVAGIRALRKIQIAKETTPGTAVTTATKRLIGTLGMKLEQKYYRPDDLETGKLSSYERSIVVGEMAKLPFASDANFEQLMYILGMSVKGGVTATGPTDSQYVWTYTPNLTASNAVDTYTIQYGDDIQEFYSPFCFGTDLEISGTLDEAVKVKSALVGQFITAGTFTALTNPTTLTPVITNTGKFYVDTAWASLGGTNKAATVVDFSYKLSEGITAMKYLDGNLYFSDRAEKKRHIELNLTLAFNSVSYAMWAAYIAASQTQQFCRLEFTGPLIGATAHDILDLDGCFVIDDYDTLTERDGQDIVKLKMLSEYDSTGTAEWQIILKNAVATL